MDRIASFCVDHNKLQPGVYVSRIDGDITTYDLRFIKPNTPPFLESPVMHTIEHLFATYSRNGRFADNVIYFGPMGCRTGFYFLVRNLDNAQALDYIKEVILKCSEHVGEIPGNTAVECGNYLEHDPIGAKKALKNYYSVIENLSSDDIFY